MINPPPLPGPPNPRPPVHAYPPGVTFHDLIRRNKRNTWWLIVAMSGLAVAVVIAFYFVFTIGFGLRPSGIGLFDAAVVAVIVTLLTSWWSYEWGASTVLSIAGARPIEKADDPQLYNVVEELAIAAGLPMPRVYLIDTGAMNAFATGRDPQHAAVAITTGLRGRLTRDELQGVLAHEMSHVRHYDTRLTMMVATIAGVIVLASDVAMRSLWYGGGSVRRRNDNGEGEGRGGGSGNPLMIVLLVLSVVLIVLAPLFAQLIQFAVSRQREYLADAGAAELTRYPQGLADALKKLGGDHSDLPHASRATAHLYILNPILHAMGEDDWDSVFATHPPLHKRIERLEAMMR